MTSGGFSGRLSKHLPQDYQDVNLLQWQSGRFVQNACVCPSLKDTECIRKRALIRSRPWPKTAKNLPKSIETFTQTCGKPPLAIGRLAASPRQASANPQRCQRVRVRIPERPEFLAADSRQAFVTSQLLANGWGRTFVHPQFLANAPGRAFAHPQSGANGCGYKNVGSGISAGWLPSGH